MPLVVKFACYEKKGHHNSAGTILIRIQNLVYHYILIIETLQVWESDVYGL